MLRHVLIAAAVAAAFPPAATAAVPGTDDLVAFTVHEPGGGSGFDVVGPDGAGRRALLRDSGAYSPAWSPDGRWVAYVAGAGELRVVAGDSSRVVRLDLGSLSPGAPAWSPDGMRIAFHAPRDGAVDLHVAHVPGFADAGPRFQVPRIDRVTVDGGRNRSPAWSPDGARLAYVGNGELRVIDAGGGVPEPRAPGLAAEDPDWSPDGQRIAFAAGGDLWAVAAAGGAPARLLAGASQPAWSPSGRRVAYASGGDLGVLELATGGTATLAGGPGSETAPTWAPVPGSAPGPAPERPYGPGLEARHAGRIAFTSDRDGDAEIYVMNPGGGDVRQLTRNRVVDRDPAWAPPVPGQPARLAFVSSRDGAGEVYVMRADGRAVRRLTSDPGVHRAPAWSPDGRAIAFTRIPPGGAAQVWIADAAGGGERRVSPDGAAYADPSWSPDGARLAFERVDTSRLIPPGEPVVTYPAVGPDGETIVRETRVIGLGFCTAAVPAGQPLCRDSVSHEVAPVWGGAHERALGRLVYVALGAGAPDFGFLRRFLWSTDLVAGTPYAHARWAYDAVILADLEAPADPAVAPDGSGMVVGALHDVLDDGLDIAVVRTLRRRPGGLESPTWQVIDAKTLWLTAGPGRRYSSQPSWEARRAPLPAGADGAFDRRSRVRGRLRRGALTLINRNRFWVTARVRQRTVRLRPATRRRATVVRVRVRVRGRVRRVRIVDAAGHRRAIRVRSLST